MADVLVLPSYGEGLPNVVVEAMACQRPVIATKVGGIPEAVVDGKSGMLVDPGNTIALAEAMMRLAEDDKLRFQMGVVGRQIVLKKFSGAKSTERLIKVYKSTIS
jgi:glycosyltransferase involved in cell wall biosynthesis